MHVEDEAVTSHRERSSCQRRFRHFPSVVQSSGVPTLPSGRTGIRTTVPFSVFVT